MPIFRCATCVFFSPNPVQNGYGVRGQCRRHAPALDRDPEKGLRTTWPMVSEDAWCGEHAEVDQVEDPAPPRRPIEQGGREPDREPPSNEPEWECVNCKNVVTSKTQPDQCVACRCRVMIRAGA